MRTDELIVELVRSARPVTPLASPGVRAMRWLAAAVIMMMAVILLVGPRDDFAQALGRPIFLGSIVVLLLALVAGASSAFALSIPGTQRSAVHRVLPGLAAATWPAIWLAVWSSSGHPTTAAFHLACALEIIGGALLAGALLFTMIVRGMPLRPLPTAAIASVAGVATGAVVAQILCPLDDPRHQLLGHVFVASLVAGAALLIGRRAIRN